MTEKMPVAIRIISILASVALFLASGITLVVGVIKMDYPNFIPLIIISGVLLLVSIVLPLVMRRKVLVVSIIFSALSVVSSTVFLAIRPLMEEVFEIVKEEQGKPKEETVEYVSDPDTASLTPAQVAQRTNAIFDTTDGVYSKMLFDRRCTLSKRRTNRQSDLYKYRGERYADSELAFKKFPDHLPTQGNLSIYTNVHAELTKSPRSDYSYWVNGSLGFVVKITETGKINSSYYSFDKYTYYTSDGLIEKQTYRIFVYPSENSDEIYDAQAVYKYDLYIHSK